MIKHEQSSYISYKKIKNIKSTSLSILRAILEYTSTIERRSPSIFDNYSHKYHSSNLDNYDFEDLFEFCCKIFRINDNMLVLIMMNMDKIIAGGKFILCNKNINKLFYTCLMVTQKYYEDNPINNKTFAELVGINCDELLNLEIEFMSMINFKLHIKEEEFKKYEQKITKFYL